MLDFIWQKISVNDNISYHPDTGERFISAISGNHSTVKMEMANGI